MERLCLVEDDPTIRELVAKRLESSGYQVDGFSSAESVSNEKQEWDLYVLDVLLEGDKSGLELCQEIRARNQNVPILILSALSDPTDRIEGLKVGADDYLGKPFEMEELLLRVKGMLRRRSWYNALPEAGVRFEWDGRWVDFEKLSAKGPRGEFQLSPKEAMLLKLLIEKEDAVVTREEILDKVWGYDVFPSTRTVDNFILRLRKYFEADPAFPHYLQSVRGMGYRFVRESL